VARLTTAFGHCLRHADIVRREPIVECLAHLRKRVPDPAFNVDPEQLFKPTINALADTAFVGDIKSLMADVSSLDRLFAELKMGAAREADGKSWLTESNAGAWLDAISLTGRGLVGALEAERGTDTMS
jgi:hypothetical protein